MNSYIAIALVLCIAVAQVQSQGTQSKTGGNTQTARAAAPTGGLLGRGSMLPLMAAGSGSDMMQNLFLFRMLSQGRRAGGAMGGLEPLLMSNLLGLELFGM
ncbi:uncharacterized protein LOC117343445 isoform X5 [Pecten maximus]|uniref:uncharacterized protein LOC117343445 isoform X5 n=1 Tax=Pecten maximus TaxID=6579 RepID=UPI0014580295|nr:uncharacterized protein LOC117343445 isoform X5 [Pecten maximus]